ILLQAQDVVDNCAAGISEYCALITRTGGAATGAITDIVTSYFNGQEIHTRGVDLELSYEAPVAGLFGTDGATLDVRALVNYVDKYSLSQGLGLPPVDKAGEVGAPGSGSTGVFGVPHWAGTLSVAYRTDTITAYIQERYVGGGKYDNTYN